MIFRFGEYRLDLDVERTRAFYRAVPGMDQGCQCPGCRNFRQAAADLPSEVQIFFKEIGVDPQKPCEVYVNCARADGTLSYGGFYHLCGTVLAGRSAWRKAEDLGPEWQDPSLQLTERFSVSFERDVHLLEEEFPAPVIQMEIAAEIPWVLAEKNDYPVDFND